MRDRTYPTPKCLADVERLIEEFRNFYGRPPNQEETSILEWMRSSFARSADNAAAD